MLLVCGINSDVIMLRQEIKWYQWYAEIKWYQVICTSCNIHSTKIKLHVSIHVMNKTKKTVYTKLKLNDDGAVDSML